VNAQSNHLGHLHSFVYQASPTRVLFGSGALTELPAELDRLNLSRVLVLATPFQRQAAEALASKLGGRASGVFAEAAMHTPIDVTERAMEVIRRSNIDGLVAVGGGSTTGLSKAIALRTDLPQVISPTSYAGSEMTPILGETANGQKVTISDPKVSPEVVLYDVDLTFSLPIPLSVTSGMNAIAHAVEALYAHNRNPITSILAESGIAAMHRALPRIVLNAQDRGARAEALYGAWLCGTCLGTVGMALHHKLCHTLGGMFNLPHAETHTAVLPHAVAYNASAAPEAVAALRRALGVEDVASGIYHFASSLGAPMSLKELGMSYEGIEEAADAAVANPYPNPRPLDRNAIRDLIAAAWLGRSPENS